MSLTSQPPDVERPENTTPRWGTGTGLGARTPVMARLGLLATISRSRLSAPAQNPTHQIKRPDHGAR